MGKFVYFTSAEKRQANEVDLPSFLLDRGEKLIMAGREYRLVSDHSITVRGPMWYDHAARKGGRAISFVQQFYDKTYPEAVSILLGRDGQGIIPIAKQEPEPQEPKPFALPKPYLTMRRMYAYLTKHRCIDRDVVTAFVQEKLLYEDDPHHNCVFVGLDENGEARHAHLRSTGSQGKVFRINVESSDIKHSFHKTGRTVPSMSLKHPLIYCLTLPSTRQVGWSTAMWPAAAPPSSPYWSACGRTRSWTRCTSVWIMTRRVRMLATVCWIPWRIWATMWSVCARRGRTGTMTCGQSGAKRKPRQHKAVGVNSFIQHQLPIQRLLF